MRIAALVHNGVLNDARVIKEALSLRRAGHEVEIHGISPDGRRQQHVLPGSDVHVFLEPRAAALMDNLGQRGAAHVLVRLGVIWPLQGAVLALAGWALWRAALAAHRRFDASLGVEVVWALVAVAAAIGGAGLLRHRRVVWRAVSALLARLRLLLRARRDRAAQAAPGAGLQYARITTALAASLARRPSPDVIHLHDHIALVLAARLKARYGVPIVWDAHEIYQALADGDPARAAANRAIIEAGQHHVDRFITINDSIARYYRSACPALPPAQVVMNATEVKPSVDDDGRLHRAAGLPPQQRIVLFQGVMAAHRGLSQLVEAAAHWPAPWSLVLMGWGELEGELRAAASRAPHRDGPPAVVFLPGVPQHELARWTAGATLGAIPYENTSLNHLYCTPNKLWEYPMAGVPVLCTDLEETRPLIEAHGFGFLLPRSFTTADVIAAVASLDDARLARARENCARFLAANNWSHWERNLLQAYEGLDRRATAPSLRRAEAVS